MHTQFPVPEDVLFIRNKDICNVRPLPCDIVNNFYVSYVNLSTLIMASFVKLVGRPSLGAPGLSDIMQPACKGIV